MSFKMLTKGYLAQVLQSVSEGKLQYKSKGVWNQLAQGVKLSKSNNM